MRIVIQRVQEAQVRVDGVTVGQIAQGLLLLVGFAPTDTEEKVARLAEKVVNLRIFSDANDRLNLNLQQAEGHVLVVSQFTLLADLSGRRPGFQTAAPPELAQELYQTFLASLERLVGPVQTGQFGAYMQVSLVNDGPVTFVLDEP